MPSESPMRMKSIPARSTSSAVGKSVAVTWNTFSHAATFASPSKIVSFFGSPAIASPCSVVACPALPESRELRLKPGTFDDTRVGDVTRHLAAQHGKGALARAGAVQRHELVRPRDRVRREHDALEAVERRPRGERLLLEYVERRPCDALLGERTGERRLVDDRPASGVHQVCRRLHQPELGRPDQVAGLRREGAVDAHEVRFTKQYP